MKTNLFISIASGIIPNSASAMKRVEKQLAEALEKQLAANIELVVFNLLLWGAAGAVGAIVLARVSSWVSSRIARRKKISALLEELEKNQDHIEKARSACLHWQLASIKEREKTVVAIEQMRHKRKHAAMTQSELEVERSERLRLQLACTKEREQKAEVQSKMQALRQEIDDLKLANVKLLRTIREIGGLQGKLPRQ